MSVMTIFCGAETRNSGHKTLFTAELTSLPRYSDVLISHIRNPELKIAVTSELVFPITTYLVNSAKILVLLTVRCHLEFYVFFFY